MQLARLFRLWGLLLIVGLAGISAGCGPEAPAPVTKEEGKRIKDDLRAEHLEAKQARKQR